MSVRTTVYLDEVLLNKLHAILPPRSLNRFINDVLAEKMSELERRQIEEAMKEGYQRSSGERAELNRDWEAIDTEDWPE